MDNKKSNKKVIIGIGVVVILLIIVALIIFNMNKNTNIEAEESSKNEEYTTLLKDIVKIGDYVDYKPVDERFSMTNEQTGTSETSFQTGEYDDGWRIMYNDNENGLQIISTRGVTQWLTLSGKFGYNNMVDTLNDFCNHYANNTNVAISGRCLGSNPTSPIDNSGTEEHFSAGALKVADENYKYDLDTINQYSLHSPGENTLLASRYTDVKDGLNRYCIRTISTSGDLSNDSAVLYFTATTQEIETGVKAYYGMDTNTGLPSNGYVRPVITLNQNVKVKEGDGTKDNPYILVE